MKKSGKRTTEENKIWELSGNYYPSQESDKTRALARFKEKIFSETSGQPAITAFLRKRWPLTVAASLILLVGLAFFINHFINQEPRHLTAVTSVGEKAEVLLPDGSRVWLNGNSELRYPKEFASSDRNVEFKGEAYFEIASQASRPFRISSDISLVEVLGTRFNLHNDSHGNTSELFLLEGKVKLSSRDGVNSTVLSPGEKAILSKRNGNWTIESYSENQENALSWKNGILTFKNSPLQKVFEDLEKHYRIDLELDNSSLSDCRFTTRFDHTPLPEVFKTLEKVFGLNITQKENRIFLISGGGC